MSEVRLPAALSSIPADHPCPICERTMAPFARAKILRRHDIQYFRCTYCGFTHTEDPYWLQEAYHSGMSDLDLGPVNRCLESSEITRALLLTCFNPHSRFLDYGAGYGMFVRRMRDLGFDFRYFDKYPTNHFAKGFEGTTGEQYELLTAFEVFEHMPAPLAEIRSMLSCSRSILFSTLVMPAHGPKSQEWWYYGLDHGQHVSFYTQMSLSFLAQRLGLNLVSDGFLFHLLTPAKISPRTFRWLIRPGVRVVVGAALARYRGMRSLLQDDLAETIRRAAGASGPR